MKKRFIAGILILSFACLTGCDASKTQSEVTEASKEVQEAKAMEETTGTEESQSAKGLAALASVYLEGFNVYDLSALPIEEELVETMFEDETVRIERIISTGQITAEGWYDQEEDEWIVLAEGSATLEYKNGEILELTKGSTLFIPAHEVHRVIYTSSEPACVWVCVFWK